MLQIPIDCLNDIVEYLEDDSMTLYSCLLVNRIWCKISVRIYWRYMRNLNTLITCLPNDSKEILHNNEILISTSESPVFNYASFCKYLNVREVSFEVKRFLRKHSNQQFLNLSNKPDILLQEIFKLLMSQVSSLRELTYSFILNLPSITFTLYPGAKDCLKNLSMLRCNSNIYPEFFYQLSKICQTIHTLRITFNKVISNGLEDLISAQQNLRHLYVREYRYNNNLTDIITLLEKIPNSLITFGINVSIPLSFIARFTNLQELGLSCRSYGDFNRLQYVIFPQLQILRFTSIRCPRSELLIKFLENNGKNLKEFYIKNNDNSLNLTIAKFCPNLRKLSTRIEHDVLETLKLILIGCQHLESIRIFSKGCNNEESISEIITKYSPKVKITSLVSYY